MYQSPRLIAAALVTTGLAFPAWSADTPTAEAACSYMDNPVAPATGASCAAMEQVTIFGQAEEVRDIAGGASVLSEADLAAFEATDVVRALRRTPGIALQIEDGYGLRPNISIRGTPTERSSRITLLEDNVLIAPAPYSAPAAYYFPTFGRISSLEVLKGPASITQGPYTVGGALNLVSTPIPDRAAGRLQGEFGSDATWRVHANYGGSGLRHGFLVETHQWQSDGYQTIDRNPSDTGFDKQDYLAKLRLSSDPASSVQQFLDVKIQASEEQSRQSYLGLTDADLASDGLRRYGASGLDEMDNEHTQVTATWRIEMAGGTNLAVTGYNNDFERAWYKTEGMDFDGSEDAQSFDRTSWFKVIDAINRGQPLEGLDTDALQAILDGADTPYGSIQLRNNSRTYYSRGLQLTADHALDTGSAVHFLQAGLRYHLDEEDRLQRNDTYQQLDGQLVLNDVGLQGNAGNRVQDASAWAAFVYDRIEWERWTLTPGLRFESIELNRVDWNSSSEDPDSREPDNLKGMRSNTVDVWIPGMGLLYDISDNLRLVAGVHKGFSTPGNKPGVDPEESIDYEFGLRYENDLLALDVLGFYNDYKNLVGVCTNSSGSDCEPGDAFNGDGVHVPGLEVNFHAGFEHQSGWRIPLQMTWTWMNAEFQTDFDSEFFGEVRKGDPVPYIPDHQARASVGMEKGPFAAYLSGTWVDAVCTQASCDDFEHTDSAMLFDLAVHYTVTESWELYALAENLSDEIYIAGRAPYGARPDKPRSFMLGARFGF